MIHRKEVFLSDQTRIKGFWVLLLSLKEFYSPTCISLFVKWPVVWPVFSLTFWRKDDGCTFFSGYRGTVIFYAILKYKPLSDFQLLSAFNIVNQRPLPFALFQSMLFHFMLPQKSSRKRDWGTGSMC